MVAWRAHVRSIVSIDLAEDKGLVITASTDCCVRLWTMRGRYIGEKGGGRGCEGVKGVRREGEEEEGGGVRGCGGGSVEGVEIRGVWSVK